MDDALKERTENWYAKQRNGGVSLEVPEEELDSRQKSPRRARRGYGKQNEEYNPHIDETADLPTMHEAYQFLKKTYVDDIVAKKMKNTKV